MFARTERPEHRGRTSSRTLRGQLGMIGPRLRCSLCFVCRKEKACASERDAGQPPAGRCEAAQSGASRTTLAAEGTAVSDEGGWEAIIEAQDSKHCRAGTGRRHWATRRPPGIVTVGRDFFNKLGCSTRDQLYKHLNASAPDAACQIPRSVSRRDLLSHLCRDVCTL